MGFLKPARGWLRGPRGIAASLIAVAALALSACPPSAPEDLEFSAQQLDAGSHDTGFGDLGTVEARVLPTIDGTWLQFSQLATCVDIITSEEGISRTLFIIESTQDEQGFVDETWTACLMELPPVLDLDTFITENALRGIYPAFTTGGYVTDTAPGGGYASGLLSEVWGIRFDDPLRDEFPISADDPRIYDADLDGNPGITVLVSTLCETHTIQRAITGFQGVYTAPDRIEGTMVSFTVQLTVGATEPFCGTTYDTRPNDGRNTFTRIRIDGQGDSLNLDENGDGEITCDEVTPYTNLLFERRLPDDQYCLR